MEARGQETRVQAPVLLRCVVAADMQVSFFLLRWGARSHWNLVPISAVPPAGRNRPPVSCPAVPIGSISVHLFSSSAFDTNLSIIYTNVNVSLQSRKVPRRTEDCLCVTTTARTHLFYLFIYHFNFSCVPPFSKMGGEGGEQVEVGWRKLVVRARLCLRHEKPREGCLPPWLSLLERESHSPLLLEDGKREEDYYYCTINHREPRGRERERKETRRIIISMTRDNVQKITIGKKKRRRCWTVVVAAETSVAATAAADEFQRLRANFMAIVSFSFSSTAGWLLLPFQILTAAIYQVMHLWCLGAAATAACPFIFIMHLCGIRIYIYIFFSFFFFNKSDRQVALFPSCFFTLWILKEKHREKEKRVARAQTMAIYIVIW